MLIHVAVADDYAPIRTALQRFFEHESGFQWVAGVADAEEATLLVRTRHVNALILDLSMPGLGGLAALPRLRAAAPHTRIVVLSSYAASVYAQKALELGASAYLEKPADLDEVVLTIRNAMSEGLPS